MNAMRSPFDLPRFAGWWGHDKDARFLMDNQFVPMRGVEGWQLSNPPILSMAAIRASLDVFMEAGFKNLVAKSRILTQYMEFLIDQLDTDRIRIITPKDLDQRGCQLSIQVKDANKEIFTAISEKGVIADWRGTRCN
jgi:kynureninase